MPAANATSQPAHKPRLGFLLPTNDPRALEFISHLAPALSAEFDCTLIGGAPRVVPEGWSVQETAVPEPTRRGFVGLIAAARAFAPQLASGFDAIVTFHTGSQRVLGMWRRFCRPRTHIVRVWLEEDVLPITRLDRHLLCKQTSINFQLGFAQVRQPTDPPRPGVLELDNPFFLADGPRLTEPGAGRIAAALRGLFFANRSRGAFRAATDWSHIRLTYITHFYLNQQRTDSVTSLLEEYARYPKEVLDAMHFVIVDDGSPIECAPPAHLDLNLTWLKIDQDIRWNQGGARNLGVVYAKSDAMLITDLDLAFPPDTLQALIEHGSPGKHIYKFYERDPESGALKKGHPNNFFLSRSRFLRFYGYDEEFTGNYGAEDFRFIKFQKSQGTRVRYFNRQHTFIRRSNLDRKKSYHSLVRDLSENTPVDSRKRLENQLYGYEAGHSRMFLEFTWTVKAVRQRSTRPQPQPHPSWKNAWLLRALLPW